MSIDLHLHTNHSDGSSSVSELLIEAQSKCLEIIAITDHNTVSAYKELEDENIRKLYDGEIITGVELSTSYNRESIEILGYRIDINIMDKLINENYLSSEQKRIATFETTKQKYSTLGVKMDIDNMNQIFDPTGKSGFVVWNEIRKYSENSKFFIEKTSNESFISFTRNEFLNPKSKLYIDQTTFYPTIEKTIDMIHEAGGLAFLAHPYIYSKTIEEELQNIVESYEIDGLECCYTTFKKEQTKCLLGMCDKYKLYRSGGSDYHGENYKVNFNMAIGDGSMDINKKLVEDWI